MTTRGLIKHLEWLEAHSVESLAGDKVDKEALGFMLCDIGNGLGELKDTKGEK